MKTPSPVLEALARRYERSQAGRTGTANRDLLVLLEELLAEADRRMYKSKRLRKKATHIVVPDPAESAEVIQKFAGLFARMAAPA